MSVQLTQRERKSRFIRKLYTQPPKTVCPNFYLLAHQAGCMFEPQCSYCYLRSTFGYLDGPEAYTNLDQMEHEIRNWIARDDLDMFMLNAGTMTDSFSFETTRPMVAWLVEIFREAAKGRPHTLLFVTKGGRRVCQALYEVAPCENVIVSFSVNHPLAAHRLESGAATVEDRLQTAREVKDLGWRLRMRIDPMILGYDYSDVARQVRDLKPERVTLGTLRADPDLLRYVHDGTFDELTSQRDVKMMSRYPLESRLELYRQAIAALGDVCPIALCEEGPEAWDTLGLDKETRLCNCCV